jgi:hypothetical protein
MGYKKDPEMGDLQGTSLHRFVTHSLLLEYLSRSAKTKEGPTTVSKARCRRSPEQGHYHILAALASAAVAV